MARGGRRSDAAGNRDDGDGDDGDTVDLSAPEHAWWAGNPDPLTADPVADRPHAGMADRDDSEDPYALLKIPPSASWDDIVASYRRLARWWHPDTLRDPAPGERELCDDMIRRLNIAYTELRVRRGR